MVEKTERELRQELKELREHKSADADADDITVEWHDADPEARPEGMAYDAETGTLSYDAWSAQREFRDALADPSTDLAAFLAGYGAGKSVTGARWLLTQAVKHPGSRFLAMGVSYSEARASTFQTLFEELPGEHTHRITSSYNGPENSPLVDDYNRAEHRITLTNGSEITLGSADKWNRYAGAEYGGIWMDEPSHYGDELHDLLEMMGSRLRGVAGPHVIAMTLTGNGYNAAWEILAKRQDSTGEPLGIEIELVRASTLDNPYIDEATKERFKRQYEGSDREEQALHGGFEAAQGLVYSNFSRETHVIPAAHAREIVESGWRIYGYDAGWKDPRVLVEVGRTPAGQYVVLDEFYRQESHVEDAIRWVDARPDGTLICEHNPSDIDRFRGAGHAAIKAKKDIEAGIADVRRRLETDEHTVGDGPSGGVTIRRPRVTDVYTDNVFNDSSGPGFSVRDEPGDADADADRTSAAAADQEPAVGLLVSNRCKHLIREFLSYKEEEVGTSSADDHCLDCVRYVVHTTEGSGDDDDRERPDHHGIRLLG